MSFWDDIKLFFEYQSKKNRAYRIEQIKHADTEAQIQYQLALKKKKAMLENQKKPFLEREY